MIKSSEENKNTEIKNIAPTNSSNNIPEKDTYRLTPVGAIIIIICFFLPWFNLKCFSKSVSIPGWRIAELEPLLWGVLLTSIFVFIIYILSKNELQKVKKVLVTLYLIGAGILVFKILEFLNKLERYIQSFELNIGIIGIVIGYIIGFIGVAGIRSSSPATSQVLIKVDNKQKKCSKCGELSNENDKYCNSCGMALRNIDERIDHDKVCPKCGSSISEKFKFCNHCGTKIFEYTKLD